MWEIFVILRAGYSPSGSIARVETNEKIFFSALALLVIGFLLLQILPLTQGHSNPPVLGEPNWHSSETRVLAQRACFDCHSNETKWPWYSYIYPMSNMVGYDVEEGRKYLNFSEWNRAGRQQAKTEEMVETISKARCPYRTT